MGSQDANYATRRRRRHARLAAALLLPVVAGLACAGVLEREVRLTRGELQERVAAAFPVAQRVSLAQLTFSEPRILLAAGSDRIGLALAVAVELSGLPTLAGRMGADGALAYRGDSGRLVITDARLKGLEVAGLPAHHLELFAEVATRVAARYFAEITVYRMPADGLQAALTRLTLKSVEVRDSVVVATVGL